jgi:threonine aldolase
VGDDLMREDPTVHRAGGGSAEAMGKEAALYVPSGTMANLVALLTHCGRGDEVIAGTESHILNHEGMGAIGARRHLHAPVPNDVRGRVDPQDVRAHAPSWPRTAVVCLENTHNRCGGAALRESEMRAIADVAHERSAAARRWCAHLQRRHRAGDRRRRSLVASADTVNFCFSKGLGAPVGSVLTGSAEFIDRAWANRRLVGGAMRQSGVIAAAALWALAAQRGAPAEDHATRDAWRTPSWRCRTSRWTPPGWTRTSSSSRSTGWTVTVPRAPEGGGRAVQRHLQQRIRLACHLDVSSDDIDEAITRIARVLGSMPAAA